MATVYLAEDLKHHRKVAVDEESVRDLATIHHDCKTYIKTVRLRISDLEQLLLSDLEGYDEMVDVGWNADSLTRDFVEPSNEVSETS